jgi:hypothetical protein
MGRTGFMAAMGIMVIIFMSIPVIAGAGPLEVSLRVENPRELQGLPIYINYELIVRDAGNIGIYNRYSLLLGNVTFQYRIKDSGDGFRAISFHDKDYSFSGTSVQAQPGHRESIRDRIRRTKALDIFSPGIYELQVKILTDTNGVQTWESSNVAVMEVKKPEGVEQSAYEIWSDVLENKKRKKKINGLKRLVEQYPGTRYALNARMDLAIHCANKTPRNKQVNNENAYRETLNYILPVVHCDQYIGCMDHALDIARICYEKLGDEQKAMEMAGRLITEYPNSEFTKKVKELKNS